ASAWRRAAATTPSDSGTLPIGRRSASCGGTRPTSTPSPSARTVPGWLRPPGIPRCASGTRSHRPYGRGRSDEERRRGSFVGRRAVIDGAGLPGHGANGSGAGEAPGGVAGTVELDAHPVHVPEVHAAELGAFVPGPWP